ncbi:MAG TPA: diadenylate cyclase CdaA [Bacteroidales bacterium]|nr:diadenylate cyclase CdaA [Bacteroidales bacterium]HPE57586.1 diadenylate cyclase CdaA [Bacteroidales bacterium]HRX96536.1 diadenylate cyclase CdaA [Bacteroidales bacterium]
MPEMLAFIEIKFLDILDILLVAFLLYELYNLLKGTVAINIFFGIVAFYLLWKLVTALEMKLLGEIFGAFISVGFIALIVVFQPEIRKFLLMLGTPGFIQKKRSRFLFWKFDFGNESNLDIDKILLACNNLSEKKTGALIIITNKSGLEQYVNTGDIIDANVSNGLIENIFTKNAPLHDGAMIIHHNKIRAVGCILPVSSSKTIPAMYGLRHRAAVGVTEQSDALAIIISEETGSISIARHGKLRSRIQPTQLKNIILENLE